MTTRKRKPYAECTGVIVCGIGSEDSGYRLIEELCRSSLALGKCDIDGKKPDVFVRIYFTYTVHGGFENDIIKKVAKAARDAKVYVHSLHVNHWHKKFIPEECYKLTCDACDKACEIRANGGNIPSCV